MKPPPAPLTASGLSERCQDALGKPLVVRCEYGWGWTRRLGGHQSLLKDDDPILAAHLKILPEGFVRFTTTRSGVYGAVLSSPEGYSLKRFVAFTMSEGCDYDFTEHIAPAWRVMLGDGEVDYESWWFPVLDGKDVYFGYGAIGQSKHYLDLHVHRRRDANSSSTNSPAAAPGEPPTVT